VRIDDLAEARAEAERSLKEAQAAGPPWTRAVLSGARALLDWLLSVPAKLSGLARMSRAEWAALFSRTWAAVKAEAHHYWVRARARARRGALAHSLARLAPSCCTWRCRSPRASSVTC